MLWIGLWLWLDLDCFVNPFWKVELDSQFCDGFGLDWQFKNLKISRPSYKKSYKFAWEVLWIWPCWINPTFLKFYLSLKMKKAFSFVHIKIDFMMISLTRKTIFHPPFWSYKVLHLNAICPSVCRHFFQRRVNIFQGAIMYYSPKNSRNIKKILFSSKNLSKNIQG